MAPWPGGVPQARDTGNVWFLAKSRNAAWRHLPRNPKDRLHWLLSAKLGSELTGWLKRKGIDNIELP